MTYSEAIAAVNAGQYAWRLTWHAKYLELHNGSIYVNDAGVVSPYNPAPDDPGATNWDSGDHPPKL